MWTIYIASIIVSFVTVMVSAKVTKDDVTVQDILVMLALCAVPTLNVVLFIMALHFVYLSSEFSKKVRVVLDKRVF